MKTSPSAMFNATADFVNQGKVDKTPCPVTGKPKQQEIVMGTRKTPKSVFMGQEKWKAKSRGYGRGRALVNLRAIDPSQIQKVTRKSQGFEVTNGAGESLCPSVAFKQEGSGIKIPSKFERYVEEYFNMLADEKIKPASAFRCILLILGDKEGRKAIKELGQLLDINPDDVRGWK